MTDRHRAWLRAQEAKAHDAITDAYWAFTRQARAKPPCVVVPEAYRRRALVRRLLAVRP